MPLRLKVAPLAAQQIRAAAKWWDANRTKNPTGFSDEVESAFQLIRELPNAGEHVRHPTIPTLRRLLLGLSQHHLYYSVNFEDESVEILALWHTSRGSRPRL